MAIKGINIKWFDGFFLAMLATSVIIVAINWDRYHLCIYPLHIWIVVDYSTVFVFRLLMFVDNGLASGMGLDLGWQQKYARFCGRIAVLSVLSLLLYPFLWAWTVSGTLWYTRAQECLPEEGQRWGFIIWLAFSYCGLVFIACICFAKWLTRRQAHMVRAQQGIPISEYGVLVDMVRVPDWAFEAAGQELRGMGQDTAAYQPGLYLNQTQREAVEALIEELPKFRLKAVPTDCSECPICLEEFHLGSEVRGLPCAHNFHVECIDEWLRLNIKCPRCRCSVFPNLDLSALTNLRADSERSPAMVLTTRTHYVRSHSGRRYRPRLQAMLAPAPVPVHVGNAGSDSDDVGVDSERSPPPPAMVVRATTHYVRTPSGHYRRRLQATLEPVHTWNAGSGGDDAEGSGSDDDADGDASLENAENGAIPESEQHTADEFNNQSISTH